MNSRSYALSWFLFIGVCSAQSQVTSPLSKMDKLTSREDLMISTYYKAEELHLLLRIGSLDQRHPMIDKVYFEVMNIKNSMDNSVSLIDLVESNFHDLLNALDGFQSRDFGTPFNFDLFSQELIKVLAINDRLHARIMEQRRAKLLTDTREGIEVMLKDVQEKIDSLDTLLDAKLDPMKDSLQEINEQTYSIDALSLRISSVTENTLDHTDSILKILNKPAKLFVGAGASFNELKLSIMNVKLLLNDLAIANSFYPSITVGSIYYIDSLEEFGLLLSGGMNYKRKYGFEGGVTKANNSSWSYHIEAYFIVSRRWLIGVNHGQDSNLGFTLSYGF